MKPEEIRNLSPEERAAKEKELRSELLNLRFQKETGQLTDTAKIRALRKDIARVLTAQNQKTEGGRE